MTHNVARIGLLAVNSRRKYGAGLPGSVNLLDEVMNEPSNIVVLYMVGAQQGRGPNETDDRGGIPDQDLGPGG